MFLLPFFSYYGKEFSSFPRITRFYYIVLIIYIICVLSDFLDGYIARKYKLESIYGKYLDPVCDKFFSIVGLCLISIYFNFPLFILYIVVVRELLGALIGTILFFKRGFQGEAHMMGKLGMVIVSINIAYYLTLGLPLFRNTIPMEFFHLPAIFLLTIYVSGMILYLIKYFEDLKVSIIDYFCSKGDLNPHT